MIRIRALPILTLVVLSVGAFAGVQAASSAHAAKPNNQGCLGADFSTYARYGTPDGSYLQNGHGSGFGHFNASLAQSVPGLGLPIQVHLAGFIPDWYVVNSCND